MDVDYPPNKSSSGAPIDGNPSSEGRRGLALIWLIVTMTTVSVIGAAMVSLYSTTNSGPTGTHAISVAKLMAESGRRFLVSEYQNQASDIDQNKLLETLTGKTFDTASGDNSRFRLNVTSFFYRVHTNPGKSGILRVKMIGSAGFDPTQLRSGYVRIEGDDNIYPFSGTPTAAGNGDSKTYTFLIQSNTLGAEEYSSVYPVIRADIGANVTEGGTLTLTSSDTSLGLPFPQKNGMFIIEKQKIMENMPVSTSVAYRYEKRTGNNFLNVTAAPSQQGFIEIDAGTDIEIEATKFFELSSNGYFGTNPDAPSTLEGSRTFTYQLAAPSDTSVKGLKSYWNFDDSSDVPKDAYGNHSGTAEGQSLPTYTSEGRVGGAIEFTGEGALATTFYPNSEIGDFQPFAVVFWAKPNTITSSDPQVVIGSRDSGGAKQLYVGFEKANSDPTAYWQIAYGNQEYTTTISVDEGEWQHIAFIFDKTDLMVYKNGRLGWRQEYLGNRNTSDVAIRIGGLAAGTATVYSYSGLLDEVAIFNRELDLCEVREIFNVPCNVGCGEFYSGNSDPGPTTIPSVYLPFNANTNDESGTDKDGNPDVNNATIGADTAAPSLTTDRFGCPDAAYDFDGRNDRMVVAHSDSLEMSDVDEVTVAAWVKKDESYSSSQWKAILQKSDTSYNLQLNYGRPAFTVYDGSWHTAVDASFAMNTGVWYHLVGTFDGTTVRIYVDGEPVGTLISSSPISDASTQNVGIGYNTVQSGRYFNGQIDDVTIWQRALTASEISAYFELTSHK